MPTPNVPLLRQTLAHIEVNPDEWKQEHYRCRTGMCFAGWAVTLDGGRWLTDEPHGHAKEYLHAVPEDAADDVFAWEQGQSVIDVADRAQRVLGLTDDQADRLFDGYNDLDDLRRIVASLAGGE